VLPDQGKAVLGLAQLSPADVDFVAKWRAANPTAPLADPLRLGPWPGEAAPADIGVKLKTEDPKGAAFVYEGAHFIMQSDVSLPLGVVRDLNGVFEATHAALMALPLGLHRGGEKEKYAVHFFLHARAVHRRRRHDRERRTFPRQHRADAAAAAESWHPRDGVCEDV